MASIIADVSRHFEVVLKDKQVEAIETFVNGSDVFVALPTGYGKSLIYGLLPSQEFSLFVTHIIPLEQEGSIVICVCPRVSHVLRDGTRNLTKYGSKSGTR